MNQKECELRESLYVSRRTWKKIETDLPEVIGVQIDNTFLRQLYDMVFIEMESSCLALGIANLPNAELEKMNEIGQTWKGLTVCRPDMSDINSVSTEMLEMENNLTKRYITNCFMFLRDHEGCQLTHELFDLLQDYVHNFK